MRLSVIIVTYNSAPDIRACLDSVQRAAAHVETEVFVVDNASPDQTAQIVRAEYPRVTLMANPANVGFAAANNQGIARANGSLLILLNPDTIVPDRALVGIAEFMEANPDCGVSGPILLDENGTETPDLREPAFFTYLAALTPFQRFLAKRVSARNFSVVSGACLCSRKSITDQLGGLDEHFFYFEDVEFSLRVKRAGHRVCRIDDVQVTHLGGRSAATNTGLKEYVRHASFLGFLVRHHSVGTRIPLMGLALVEVSLMAAKNWMRGVLSGDPLVVGKARGLFEVLRDFRDLSGQAYWEDHHSVQAVIANKSFLAAPSQAPNVP